MIMVSRGGTHLANVTASTPGHRLVTARGVLAPVPTTH